ncbi:MAG: glycosyl hydrolase family 28-related protein [Geminicoccaceae bacterium]
MSNIFARDPKARIQYSGDGSRTSFAFPFPILGSDDLLVFLNGAPATGFAISGLGHPDGGDIIFAEPPAAGSSVTLLRRTESIRETAFVDGGPFRASAINAELDRVMMLIQEDRDGLARALRRQPDEGEVDFCLPAVAQRANNLLGFDSAGRPAAFGVTELPTSGDASGLVVTPGGATTARALGEHLSSVANVRDFGAKGDGATDDSAAFQAAIAAAQGRLVPVYVPASPTPYVLGSSLVLDGIAMIGEEAGSTLKSSLASGAGLELTGNAPRLSALRVLGPGANVWPASPTDIALAGVALDGIRVASGAAEATLASVEIAGCHTGLAIEGHVRALVGCSFLFNVNGVELRDGAEGSIFALDAHARACTSGLQANTTAGFQQLSVRGGSITACGRGIDLPATTSTWRSIELSDLRFAAILDSATEVGARHSLAVRGCHLDESGKRGGSGVNLTSSGATVEAPNLIAENTRAEVTRVVSVQLSGGTNLNLLQTGDLIVLASDPDDVDDFWTAYKATRAGVVHRVVNQTVSTAEIELAIAVNLPFISVSDVVRVVGRSGTATVDSVGTSTPAAEFTWLRAEDHCRVFSANVPMPLDQIDLVGTNSDLRYFPGLGGEALALSGVQLAGGTINGAFARLLSFAIAQDTAISFVPDSSIGMVHTFSHGILGDPGACAFTYRAGTGAFVQLLANVATVQVQQGIALTGTSGSTGVFTFSAHTDGKIYVENRMTGAPRTISLFVIGAPI